MNVDLMHFAGLSLVMIPIVFFMLFTKNCSGPLIC